MKQKKFMHIERAKFDTNSKSFNIGGFEPGDIIQITEKWDGSNASIRYDEETGKLVAFSRNNELSEQLELEGFWNYVQTLNPEDFKDTPNYIIFGEWGARNRVIYNPEFYNQWYVYDIYDVEQQKYLLQSEVKEFVKRHGLTYIHILYEGEFISWNHCMSFCNSPAYGDFQEGIVIKNQTKLNNSCSKTPFVLKIVNEKYSEVKKMNKANGFKKNKQTNDSQSAENEQVNNIVNMIVTRQRVEKELLKIRDEGVISGKITFGNASVIYKLLPKRIYEDCIKEERDLVEAAGDSFGKRCNKKVISIVNDIIKGDLL